MCGGSTELERQSVLAAAQQDADAISNRDADLYFATLMEDAVFMAPNASPESGPELRRWLRQFLADVKVEYLASVTETR